MLNDSGQDNFPLIKDKFLRSVINCRGSFYLVTSKEYDRDIDILHSEDKNFNASFDRRIEPGSLEVYDTLANEDHLHGKEDICSMKTLIKIGDKLYLDVLDLDLNADMSSSVVS